MKPRRHRRPKLLMKTVKKTINLTKHNSLCFVKAVMLYSRFKDSPCPL